MSRELNQYILKEYTRLHSVMEQREFMEKVNVNQDICIGCGIRTGISCLRKSESGN